MNDDPAQKLGAVAGEVLFARDYDALRPAPKDDFARTLGESARQVLWERVVEGERLVGFIAGGRTCLLQASRTNGHIRICCDRADEFRDILLRNAAGNPLHFNGDEFTSIAARVKDDFVPRRHHTPHDPVSKDDFLIPIEFDNVGVVLRFVAGTTDAELIFVDLQERCETPCRTSVLIGDRTTLQSGTRRFLGRLLPGRVVRVVLDPANRRPAPPVEFDLMLLEQDSANDTGR